MLSMPLPDYCSDWVRLAIFETLFPISNEVTHPRTGHASHTFVRNHQYFMHVISDYPTNDCGSHARIMSRSDGPNRIRDSLATTELYTKFQMNEKTPIYVCLLYEMHPIKPEKR